MIQVDIPGRRLDLCITQEEMERRQKAFVPPAKKQLTGYLKRYAMLVSSADKGAVFEESEG
jgi:dihydroxy-acid dehydratase